MTKDLFCRFLLAVLKVGLVLILKLEPWKNLVFMM